jgi:hypothetical protein
VKQIFILVSLVVLGCGIYLKFFYDVPDDQETTNFFVSGFLMITGISTLLINLFWDAQKKKRNEE